MDSNNVKVQGSKKLTKEQMDVIEKLREYAIAVMRFGESIIEVDFSTINGDRNLKYTDELLKIGDKVNIVDYKLQFNTKSENVTKFEQKFSGIKQTASLDEFKKLPTVTRQKLAYKYQLSKATELEVEELLKATRVRVDQIVDGMLNGDLTFDDPVFINLINSAASLNLTNFTPSKSNGTIENVESEISRHY